MCGPQYCARYMRLSGTKKLGLYSRHQILTNCTVLALCIRQLLASTTIDLKTRLVLNLLLSIVKIETEERHYHGLPRWTMQKLSAPC